MTQKHKDKNKQKVKLASLQRDKIQTNLKLLLFRGKREEWTGREKTPPPDYQVVKFFTFSQILMMMMRIFEMTIIRF